MKPINTVKFSFPSRSVNEGFARSAVASFAAVSEAVTNCIVHGYRNTIGIITVTASFYQENELRIVVSDRGCGIEDVQQAMQPLFTTGGEERAGLGFAVMESFMDCIKVRSKPGKGTRVTLIKKLGSR